MVDTRKLVSWRLEAGETTVGETVAFDTGTGVVHQLALFKDCSRIALVTSRPEIGDSSRDPLARVTKTWGILTESTIEFGVDSIRFFPDGRQVLFIEKHEVQDVGPYLYGKWVWKMAEEEGSATTTPERGSEWLAGYPWTSSAGYFVGDGNQWATDPKSKLPLLVKEWDRRWDDKFLTVLGNRLEPVIIEFP